MQESKQTVNHETTVHFSLQKNSSYHLFFQIFVSIIILFFVFFEHAVELKGTELYITEVRPLKRVAREKWGTHDALRASRPGNEVGKAADVFGFL